MFACVIYASHIFPYMHFIYEPYMLCYIRAYAPYKDQIVSDEY